MKTTWRSPAVALALALVAGAAPATAQTTVPQAAPGGLFGGRQAASGGRHKLDFSLSLIQANDSDGPAALSGATPADTLLGGYSTMFVGSTQYRWQGSRLQVEAGSTSVLRHYSRLAEARSVNHSGGVALTARLGPRTTFEVSQTAAYSPAYLYGLFPSDAEARPGDAGSIATDYTIDDSASYFAGTAITVARGLTRRSRVSATADVQITNFLHETGTRHDLDSRGVGGDYLNNVGRNTTMRVAYRYRVGNFGYASAADTSQPNVAATEQTAVVGVEYSRPVSGTRKVAFGFNVGSSSLTTPVPAALEAGDGRFVGLSAEATVNWQFAKGWQTRETFQRGPEYVAQLSEPVFVNGFSSELSGLVTSRIDVLATAKYSSGKSVLDRSQLKFATYGANLRGRYALTRSLAVYGEYLYYYCDFQRDTQLPTGIPPGLERNGLRAGFTLWLSALRR